jgi:hypothetical protein
MHISNDLLILSQITTSSSAHHDQSYELSFKTFLGMAQWLKW